MNQQMFNQSERNEIFDLIEEVLRGKCNTLKIETTHHNVSIARMGNGKKYVKVSISELKGRLQVGKNTSS